MLSSLNINKLYSTFTCYTAPTHLKTPYTNYNIVVSLFIFCSSSHTKAKREATVLRSVSCLPLFLQECWDAPCSCLSRLSTHPTTTLSSSTPPTSTRRWSRVTVCGWLSSTRPGKSPFWPLFSDLQWLHHRHRFSDGEPGTSQFVRASRNLLFKLRFFYKVFLWITHLCMNIWIDFPSLTVEWI